MVQGGLGGGAAGGPAQDWCVLAAFGVRTAYVSWCDPDMRLSFPDFEGDLFVFGRGGEEVLKFQEFERHFPMLA